MPELPEVETIRRGLEDKIVGLVIEDVEVRAPKIFQGDPILITNKEILALERYGKLLVFRLSESQVMTIHLKMTGQLIWKRSIDSEIDDLSYVDNAELPDSAEEDEENDDVVVGGHPEAAYLQPLPHKHTHVIFSFSDGSKLYFNDLRKFGRVVQMPEDELREVAFLQKLGPEPLEKDFTKVYLAERLKKQPNVAIKALLLDQAVVAGLGNIYVDESLFRAAILPDRAAASLKPGEISNLHEAIQETLELALLHGGSSSKDYLNAVGERGTYLDIAQVYHRTGQLCNRCLTGLIQRKKIAGRSSHYCAICQR